MKAYIIFMRGVKGFEVVVSKTKAELKRKYVGHVWVLSSEQLKKLYCVFDGRAAHIALPEELKQKILVKLGLKASNKTSQVLFETLNDRKLEILKAVRDKEIELYGEFY